MDDVPRLDDHLVVPEVTRDEVIKGRRVVAMGAEPPHGDQHFRLDFVLGAHVAPGYEGSTDLLSRFAVKSDFASDTCIRKAGIDPATGTRHLEEIAFEVVSTQSESSVRDKAEEMHGRGVRRIFAIFVKGPRRVAEWSPESRSWVPLAAGAVIKDRCLVKPLLAAALVDAALAKQAAVEAMDAQNEPAIVQLKAAAEAKGKAKGVLEILEDRGLAVSTEERTEILGCTDLAKLRRWLGQAGSVGSAGELLAAEI